MSRRHFNHREEHDPVGMLSNLFDVAMVFAVALMVALVTKINMTEIFSKDDFTIVKKARLNNRVSFLLGRAEEHIIVVWQWPEIFRNILLDRICQ